MVTDIVEVSVSKKALHIGEFLVRVGNTAVGGLGGGPAV